ncbi:hypothetical protein CNR22_08345 [Sphingobacteriaceae bacterium]|nr:hypothetical protein CNR22_08345 [Sphingobacteriaceae bacterium]
MTEKKITYALSRIKTAKQNGYPLEALLKSYHLNIDLVKFILSSTSKEHTFENKKIKVIIQEFIREIEQNTALKSIIHKRSIKALKPWLSKMDTFFKSLKLELPKNVSQLQDETEKIFGLLKISANKLFVKS